MVLINVLDHVEKCYSNNDGKIIFNLINDSFIKNKQVSISFTGISSLNSSFVNSAFIELLNHYDFDFIRHNLKFINSTRQINTLIKDRFNFEVKKSKLALVN